MELFKDVIINVLFRRGRMRIFEGDRRGAALTFESRDLQWGSLVAVLGRAWADQAGQRLFKRLLGLRQRCTILRATGSCNARLNRAEIKFDDLGAFGVCALAGAEQA